MVSVNAFDKYPTIHWDGDLFFYQYQDGRMVPTTRPHGWIAESSEKRILAALKRKGYRFEGSGPQLWTGGIGMGGYVVPATGLVANEDWRFVNGDTLAELLASIEKLP